MNNRSKLMKISKILLQRRKAIVLSIGRLSGNIMNCQKRLSVMQNYAMEYNSINYQKHMAYIPALYKNLLLFVKKIEITIVNEQILIRQLSNERAALLRQKSKIEQKIDVLHALVEKEGVREKYILEKMDVKFMDELTILERIMS